MILNLDFCLSEVGRMLARYFTTYDAALSQHNTIPTVTAVGDFEIELEFVTAITAGVSSLLSTSNADIGSKVVITGTTGLMSWLIDDGTTSLSAQPAGLVNDEKLHTALLRKVGNIHYASVDGGVEVSQTLAGVPADFELVGVSRATSVLSDYLSGIMANVNFKSGFTQTGNATGNPLYKIAEEDDALTLINDNGGLGNGTVVNAPSAEVYQLNIDATPNQWQNSDASLVVQLA